MHNFRTHRKIAICDGRVGFLGGINMHVLAVETLERGWKRIVSEPGPGQLHCIS